MSSARAVFSFFIFLVLFCFGLTIYFYAYAFLGEPLNVFSYAMGASLLGSGIALGSCFHALRVSLKPVSIVRHCIGGIFVSALLFTATAVGERQMTEERYMRRDQPEAFGSLRDHCGVYSGRSLLRLLHLFSSSEQWFAMQEFEINNTCRIRHFSFLIENDPKVCRKGEDQIDCRIRWMGAFSEHGIWNHQTRKFFFGEIQKTWPQSKKEESLVIYVSKDQELESGRQSLLRQAGVEDEFAEHFLLFHLKDDLENIRTTRKIFEVVGTWLTDVKSSPPPYLLKFKDMKEEAEPKLARIPELEKDIARLETRR